MSTPVLALWKDYEFEIDIESKLAATGAYAPAAGLTLTLYIETAIGAGSVDASLAGTMSERTGRRGRQYFVFDTADLIANLATFDGQDVFIVVNKDGDIVGERFKRRVQLASTG